MTLDCLLLVFTFRTGDAISILALFLAQLLYPTIVNTSAN
jgi:hypothetical protein